MTRFCLDTSAYSHFARGSAQAVEAIDGAAPTNDMWIAAVAAREGVQVLTYDSHFRHIERVGVQVLA